MELLNDFNTETSASGVQFSKFSILSDSSTFDRIELNELKKIKRNLLLKSNKNATRFISINRNYFQLSDEQVSTTLSILPDEVIFHVKNPPYKIRNFEAAVVFADISGFTDLSEKYQIIENGASKLSMVLNFYLGTMVSEILSLGGDIIKYAGDAFLAIFRVDNGRSMQEVIHKAIDTALIIQKNCRNFKTEVGVTLNVKIAISGGDVDFSLIGNKSSSHYAIVGEPVWAAKALQENIKAGEILVSMKAWYYAQESLYVYEYNRESRYYKIIGFKDKLGLAQRQHEALLNFYEMQKKMEIEASSVSIALREPSFDLFSTNVNVNKVESFSLRPSANIRLEEKTMKYIRRFIIPPLLKIIDLNEPIELLSEMRDVVIVFANFVVLNTSSRELMKVLDRIYNSLSGVVSNHDGIVNKVSLFDKDMMFLVVFGLRGYKHECEARSGLRCAADLHETFQTWPEISTVSIGVTKGMSYCGVVGHSLRKEYSVISVTVNKAARLMMAYPNIVSCEQKTMLSSKLPLKNFKILPKKNLKGLRGEFLVYEFKEIFETFEPSIAFKLPIFGRNGVLGTSRKLLSAAIRHHNQEWENLPLDFERTSCLVIQGELQEGKTRVLKEIYANCYKEDLRCIFMPLTIHNSKTPYFVIRKIIEKTLKLRPTDKIQIIVREKFNGLDVEDFLSALNPILGTNFPSFPDSLDDDVTTAIFQILCNQIFADFHAIFIDDVELMDSESFELLDCVFNCNATFTHITLGHQKKTSDEQEKSLQQNQVKQLFLENFDLKLSTELACHCLKVDALSPELLKFLRDNSNGSPGWIESCIESLRDKFEVKIMTKDEIFQSIVKQNFLQDDVLIQSRKKYQNFEESQVFKVAVFKQFPNQNDFIPNARNENDLMIYDTFSSYEQSVCKCASVLGVQFTRHMLVYIMSNSTDRMVGKTLVKLFELRILVCAGKAVGNQKRTSEQKNSSEVVACYCKDVKFFGSCRDLPKYACCTKMKFQREGFCSVVYDSLTEKQRLEYHRKSLFYLHLETRRCESCGSSQFPILMSKDFHFKFRDGVLDSEDTSYNVMIKYFESLNLPVKQEVRSVIKIPRKKTFKIQPIVLNYMNYDFHKCQCNAILYDMYNDMIKHCQGGQNLLKLIHTKVQLASMCICVGNFSRAEILLRKALVLLDNKKIDDVSLYPAYLRGRSLKLLGKCLQPELALELFYKSCAIFDLSFPKSYNLTARAKLQMLIQSLKKPKTKSKATSKLFSIATIQLSKTMCFMFELFLSMKQYDLAKLAAFWSLQKVLKVHLKVRDVARSFTNALKIVHIAGEANDFLWLQSLALVKISRAVFISGLDLEALTEVTRLHKELMVGQMLGNKIPSAIKIGKVAENLCSRIQMTFLQVEIVPILFHLLMKMKRFNDVLSLLQRFEVAVKSKHDKNGLIWYHALSLDFLLDATMTIIPYETCHQFYYSEMTEWDESVDLREASARFYANCLLWNFRHKVYNIAGIWKEKLSVCLKDIQSQSSVHSASTVVRYMEALTLHLVSAIDDENIKLIKHLENELKDVTKSASKLSNLSSERFELHELHRQMLIKITDTSLQRIEKLKESAQRNKDFLTLDIIKHTHRLWLGELPLKIENFWINHSTQQRALGVNDLFATDRVFPFSLPLSTSDTKA